MFVAQKSCTLRGKTYRAGEPIPKEAIDPNRVEKLLKYRVISETPEKAPEPQQNAPDNSSGETPNDQPTNATSDVKQTLNGGQNAKATQAKAKQAGKAARK